MLISVIVPVYNVEKYLRQCLDSILAQTYKELEVVMVDDGSTDSCGDICEEYAAKHENFKVIHKENAGPGLARNTALEHITGEYVVFVDADDYLDPPCIATLYDSLVRDGVDMCKCGVRRITDNGEIVLTRSFDEEIFKGTLAKRAFLPRMLGSAPDKKDGVEPFAAASIYRVKPINELRVRFSSEHLYEDQSFNIDYAQHANGASTISYVGYNYRVNPGSLMRSYRKDRFKACRNYYTETKKKLEALGYDSAALQRFDGTFFWQLRACLAQEKQAVSGLSKEVALENISKICEDEVVKDVVSNYPLAKTGTKKRIFLILIKLKAVRTLQVLIELGAMGNR